MQYTGRFEGYHTVYLNKNKKLNINMCMLGKLLLMVYVCCFKKYIKSNLED